MWLYFLSNKMKYRNVIKWYINQYNDKITFVRQGYCNCPRLACSALLITIMILEVSNRVVQMFVLIFKMELRPQCVFDTKRSAIRTTSLSQCALDHEPSSKCILIKAFICLNIILNYIFIAYYSSQTHIGNLLYRKILYYMI